MNPAQLYFQGQSNRPPALRQPRSYFDRQTFYLKEGTFETRVLTDFGQT